MDVGAWLRSLGLGKYETAFRDNAVEVDVLPKLTAEDLRDIGVTAVGDRRRLLDAIAALPAAPQPDEAPLTTERRQLTVMFVDLVGSTALSARLDPEDMRAIIAAYHKCVAAAVTKADGYVAKYMGDGVLAYFGYPRAQENDAERAVHAGLAVAENAKGLRGPTGEALHVRVGIATGVVVVGDLIGSGESSERGVVGDTPNLAARLQSVAEPDQIVIAEGTRRLIGNLFELRDLGAVELKGIAGRPLVFAVTRARAVESRFEALRGAALPELIGREEERDLLARRWARAKSGQGNVILILGEPGIGKSRLVADLLARVVEEPHVRMRYFCSQQTVDSALYPIIAQMERGAGFVREDDVSAKLDKLDALLAQTATPPDESTLIADMLGLVNDGRYPQLEAQAAVRRQKLLAALIGQIARLSRESAVLFVFEDAHWADSSTLEAISQLFDRIAGLRVLAIVTFRPEFAPPWVGQPYVTAVTLNRLTRADISVLIDGMAGGNPLPDILRRDIVERADGVPLFAEEIAKAAMEAAGEAAIRLISSLPSPDRAVPASLHASLLARLDRLGASKELAQIGAAIGRSFTLSLLHDVTRKPRAELEAALRRLVEAGLLVEQDGDATGEYMFKHALIQDAAYGTLLREPRRELHVRIAAALEAQTPDIAATRPEVLAHHYVEAGQIKRGARLWAEAGNLACAKSAYVEAQAMQRRAVKLLESLPTTQEIRKDEIEYQIALMHTLFVLEGWSSTTAIEAIEKAQTLMRRAEAFGDPLENPLALFAILYHAYIRFWVGFDGPQLLRVGRDFLSIAEHSAHFGMSAIGRGLLGLAHVETGSPETGAVLLQRAIEELETLGANPYLEIFNYDNISWFYICLARATYLLGLQDRSARFLEYAIRASRASNHIVTLASNFNLAMEATLLLGAVGDLADHFSEMVELGGKYNVAQFAMVDYRDAFECVRRGESERVPELLRRGMKHEAKYDVHLAVSFRLAFLAEAHLRLGEFAAAGECVREAFEIVERRQQRWFEADVHRIAGEIARLSANNNEAEIEACYERALAIARSQNARSLELRAATSFARMRRDQGRQEEARDLLQPVYTWFTEGFDKPDLKAALELLNELA